MEIKHKNDLVWFTSEGQGYFERSTFGGQLDACIFAAFGSKPCVPCGGSGILDKPWVQYSRVYLNSIGEEIKEKLPEPIHHRTGMTCDRCNGQGYKQKRLVRRSLPGEMRLNPTRERCQRAAPADEILLRYAFISRRLGMLPRNLAEAMLCAYGDEGEFMFKTTQDRRWAVAHLTEEGLEVLEEIRGRLSDSDSQFRAMASLLEYRDGVKDLKGAEKTRVEIVLYNVAESARQLLEMAELSWNALGAG